VPRPKLWLTNLSATTAGRDLACCRLKSHIVRAPFLVWLRREANRPGLNHTPDSRFSRSLAYAAALRLARFGNAKEHGDWEAAHHVFTYTNALDQMLKRIRPADPNDQVAAVRVVLHGAMALYLTRYLNVPPARTPTIFRAQLLMDTVLILELS
jgi:hypothetical protein